MATKTVEWISYQRLACAGCTPADVIVCTTYTPSALPAQLVSFQVVPNQCGQKFFRYVLAYDTEDLPEGVTGITCAQITGVFCKGCLTTWVEEFVAGNVENAIAQLQQQITILNATVEAQGEEIDDLTDNPKAQVFSDQAFELAYSFILNPGTPFDLDLVVTNPSSVNSMKVDADWGWDLSVVSTTAFSASGAQSTLLQDAVAVTDSDRDASVLWTTAGAGAWNFTGGTGHHHFTLAPGASTTLTLRLSESGGSPTPPDAGWSVEHIYLSAFGVTI